MSIRESAQDEDYEEIISGTDIDNHQIQAMESKSGYSSAVIKEQIDPGGCNNIPMQIIDDKTFEDNYKNKHKVDIFGSNKERNVKVMAKGNEVAMMDHSVFEINAKILKIQQENFDMRLYIYHLEQRLRMAGDPDFQNGEDLAKIIADLHLAIKKKDRLLELANQAINSMKAEVFDLRTQMNHMRAEQVKLLTEMNKLREKVIKLKNINTELNNEAEQWRGRANLETTGRAKSTNKSTKSKKTVSLSSGTMFEEVLTGSFPQTSANRSTPRGPSTNINTVSSMSNSNKNDDVVINRGSENNLSNSISNSNRNEETVGINKESENDRSNSIGDNKRNEKKVIARESENDRSYRIRNSDQNKKEVINKESENYQSYHISNSGQNGNEMINRENGNDPSYRVVSSSERNEVIKKESGNILSYRTSDNDQNEKEVINRQSSNRISKSYQNEMIKKESGNDLSYRISDDDQNEKQVIIRESSNRISNSYQNEIIKKESGNNLSYRISDNDQNEKVINRESSNHISNNNYRNKK